MSNKELIEKLREAAKDRHGDLGEWNNALIENQAAEALSSAEAEIGRLREVLERAKRELKSAYTAVPLIHGEDIEITIEVIDETLAVRSALSSTENSA